MDKARQQYFKDIPFHTTQRKDSLGQTRKVLY